MPPFLIRDKIDADIAAGKRINSGRCLSQCHSVFCSEEDKKEYGAILSLSEASPDIEVKVRMININHGHNRELLSACRPVHLQYPALYAGLPENAKKCGCRLGLL